MTVPGRLAALRTALRDPAARYLPVALATAALVELGLRLTSLPALSRLLGVPLDVGPSATDVPAIVEIPRWLGPRDEARYRAARRLMRSWPAGPEGSCLRLALTGGALLRHRRPLLHLGAARRGTRTVAHAWITIDGRVLDPTVTGYTALGRR